MIKEGPEQLKDPVKRKKAMDYALMKFESRKNNPNLIKILRKHGVDEETIDKIFEKARYKLAQPEQA